MKLPNRHEELRREMERRRGKRQSMLRMLQEEGSITTREMIRHFGTGCSSRLKELRNGGFDIQTVYEKPGVFRYVYKGKKGTSNLLPDDWDLIKEQASEGDNSRVGVID